MQPLNTFPDDLINVQNALDRIEENGEVLLAAGTFDFGDSGLVINRPCTLTGQLDEYVNRLSTIVKGDTSIQINSSGVTIRNLNIENPEGPAIIMDDLHDGNILINNTHIHSKSPVIADSLNFTTLRLSNNMIRSSSDWILSMSTNHGDSVIIENNEFFCYDGLLIDNNELKYLSIASNLIRSDTGGWIGMYLGNNECRINITSNKIQNYRWGVMGAAKFYNPRVIINHNKIAVPEAGIGIQLGHSQHGWYNCLVEKNTIYTIEGKSSTNGIGSFPNSEGNKIINNDLSGLRACLSQVSLMGRKDTVMNNIFGPVGGDIPDYYPITHPPTVLIIWSAHFHPIRGNPYPLSTCLNVIQDNDYRNCGLTGWTGTGDEISGGCILLYCLPESTPQISGKSNKVWLNFISESGKFPGETSSAEQIYIYPSFDANGNRLIYLNFIEGI
jgi:hypothetical protein